MAAYGSINQEISSEEIVVHGPSTHEIDEDCNLIVGNDYLVSAGRDLQLSVGADHVERSATRKIVAQKSIELVAPKIVITGHLQTSSGSSASTSTGAGGGPRGSAYFLDRRSETKDGGPTSPSRVWLPRELNYSQVFDLDVKLMANQVVFHSSGLYQISGFTTFHVAIHGAVSVARFCPAGVDHPKIEAIVYGSNVYGCGTSIFNGIIRVEAGNKYEIQYRSTSGHPKGLGTASGFHNNVYTSLTVVRC